jgi:hypothetical protein
MELKEYAELVQKMRSAQTEYFKARKQNLPTVANSWLSAARTLERQTDEATEAIINPPKPSPQTEMF